MRRQHIVLTLIVLSISLLILPAASAQISPRAVPTNDDFANAKPIKIGKNYTVLDISAATIDARPARSDVLRRDRDQPFGVVQHLPAH
ncbi:MAG: hypothetical protein IPK52_18540 [Chloroflexi bacterium]|nr:hypothetical protein [Chloroflexota bacterium]